MDSKEMNQLKQKLNALVEKENITTDEVIALSQELDLYIVEAQREKLKQTKKGAVELDDKRN